jgi:hypothetical protein
MGAGDRGGRGLNPGSSPQQPASCCGIGDAGPRGHAVLWRAFEPTGSASWIRPCQVPAIAGLKGSWEWGPKWPVILKQFPDLWVRFPDTGKKFPDYMRREFDHNCLRSGAHLATTPHSKPEPPSISPVLRSKRHHGGRLGCYSGQYGFTQLCGSTDQVHAWIFISAASNELISIFLLN